MSMPGAIVRMSESGGVRHAEPSIRPGPTASSIREPKGSSPESVLR